MIAPLATVMTGEALSGGSGFSLWQTLGGLVAVFSLLVVALKLLGRFNRRSGSAEAGLLTVWHLGPRREIQVLRMGDDVHYIYRHDGAMVLLGQDTLAAWEAAKSQRSQSGNPTNSPLARFFPKGLPSIVTGKLGVHAD